MRLDDFFIRLLSLANEIFPEKNDGTVQIDHIGRNGDILYGKGEFISVETVNGLLSLKFNNVNLEQLGNFFISLDQLSEESIQLTGNAFLAGYLESYKIDDNKILRG